MRTHYLKRTFLTTAALLTLFLAACERGEFRFPSGGRSEVPRVVVRGGEPARGVAVIREIGCGACHTIPGIDDAQGTVGPPLTGWPRRSFIAGAVPNSVPNLIRWISNPQDIEPATAMPNLRLTEQQACDVAAYLYTLE